MECVDQIAWELGMVLHVLKSIDAERTVEPFEQIALQRNRS